MPHGRRKRPEPHRLPKSSDAVGTAVIRFGSEDLGEWVDVLLDAARGTDGRAPSSADEVLAYNRREAVRAIADDRATGPFRLYAPAAPQSLMVQPRGATTVKIAPAGRVRVATSGGATDGAVINGPTVFPCVDVPEFWIAGCDGEPVRIVVEVCL